MDYTQAKYHIDQLMFNLEQVILGKHERLTLVVMALTAGGHILIEDKPGVGKTTLARALAKSIDGSFSRIQFTPDLLPTDITGINIFKQNEGAFEFKPGPIFNNIVLADEINRASPRTQSALLEAMNETQVTIDGTTHHLQTPFIVLGTQNPLEHHGTFPLPEGQLDRFMLQLDLDYPAAEIEQGLMMNRTNHDPIDTLSAVITLEQLKSIHDLINNIRVDAAIAQYMYHIVDATRTHDQLHLGVSIRGSLMYARMVRANALVDGRDFVTPDDVKKLAIPVLAHRILPIRRSDQNDAMQEQIIDDILKKITVPT